LKTAKNNLLSEISEEDDVISMISEKAGGRQPNPNSENGGLRVRHKGNNKVNS
jgi:hypothetical protein